MIIIINNKKTKNALKISENELKNQNKKCIISCYIEIKFYIKNVIQYFVFSNVVYNKKLIRTFLLLIFNFTDP